MCGRRRDIEVERNSKWRRTAWEDLEMEGRTAPAIPATPSDIDFSDVPVDYEEDYPLPNHNTCRDCGSKASYDQLTTFRGLCRDCSASRIQPAEGPRPIKIPPPYKVIFGPDPRPLSKIGAEIQAIGGRLERK